jgi:putative hemolysin
MVLTGDIYRLDQLPPDSVANVVAEAGELAAATDGLLDQIANHPRAVTASQRRLFDVWLKNPLDAAVNASMTEFADVFASQETHEQIARQHKRITG